MHIFEVRNANFNDCHFIPGSSGSESEGKINENCEQLLIGLNLIR